jgi:hypothetical protein
VVSIAHHIESISEHRVSDLLTLVYQCFDGAATSTFASAVSSLLAKCFQNDPTVRDWESNATMLKQMFRDLVTRSLWSALKHTKDAPSATLCRICCQYSADPHHEDTEVHLQNSYFTFKFLEENNLIQTEEEQTPSLIAFVAGFVGSIASTTNPPVEEEEFAQIVDDTPLAEPVYCQLCNIHTTCSWNEQSNDLWQRWLLECKRIYFAEHVIYTSEPPVAATTDASASEEGESWVLVERNKNKKSLIGKAGQRQSKRC